ncbi:MAG TPA: low affinity iron permease family protein [Sphingomicrobium sp.]|nr:low affinity iron permease family protein [Sphingomicrobium sp.]
MATETPREILTQIGAWTARPTAFVIVAAYALAWVLIAPKQLDWHSVATLATWLMTLFIQRSEHRDTQAIQAKLDELLRSDTRAANAMAHVDEKEPEEIEQIRDERNS